MSTTITDTDVVALPELLKARRSEGKAAYEAAPMPTRKDEQWRFTKLRGVEIDNVPSFSPAAEIDAAKERAARGVTAGVEVAAELLHVNGETIEASVKNNSLPEGVIYLSLATAATEYPELVAKHLGAVVGTSNSCDDKFVNLNTATMTGGVFFYVPKNVKVDLPVRADIVMTTDSSVNWRALIVLEEGAEATFLEEFTSTNPDHEGFSNAVVELIALDNAKLHYVTAQDYAIPAQIFATHRVHAHRDANVDWTAIGTGGSMGKSRMEANLVGAGSNVKLTGAYVVDGHQQIDYDTYQLHQAPHAVSDLAFKGVVSDKAHSIWRGMIEVAPGAQGTDAFQENRNLMLNPGAHVDSIPGLKIEANEVRCTHAATTSKVDPEQLFYFQARGISKDEAVRELVRGFFTDVLDRIEVEQVREQVQSALWKRIER